MSASDRENSLAEAKRDRCRDRRRSLIGSEIAKKFASEGFTVFAGRRNNYKLEPLVKEIEAAGGEIHARSLDARKEEEIVCCSLAMPTSTRRSRPASSTSAPT